MKEKAGIAAAMQTFLECADQSVIGPALSLQAGMSDSAVKCTPSR